MERIPEYALDMPMGSLIAEYGKASKLIDIWAVGFKTVVKKDTGETIEVLVVVDQDGNPYATRSGGLVSQFKRMVQKWAEKPESEPEHLEGYILAKPIDDPNYPPGSETWEFRPVLRIGRSRAS